MADRRSNLIPSQRVAANTMKYAWLWTSWYLPSWKKWDNKTNLGHHISRVFFFLIQVTCVLLYAFVWNQSFFMPDFSSISVYHPHKITKVNAWLSSCIKVFVRLKASLHTPKKSLFCYLLLSLWVFHFTSQPWHEEILHNNRTAVLSLLPLFPIITFSNLHDFFSLNTKKILHDRNTAAPGHFDSILKMRKSVFLSWKWKEDIAVISC